MKSLVCILALSKAAAAGKEPFVEGGTYGVPWCPTNLTFGGSGLYYSPSLTAVTHNDTSFLLTLGWCTGATSATVTRIISSDPIKPIVLAHSDVAFNLTSASPLLVCADENGATKFSWDVHLAFTDEYTPVYNKETFFTLQGPNFKDTFNEVTDCVAPGGGGDDEL